MNRTFLTLLCLLPLLAFADNIDKIAGKYEYKQFQITNPIGKVLGQADFGVKSMTLEIKQDGENRKVISSMQMIKGNVVKETGLIQRIGLKGRGGYWVTKWEEIDYPIRTEFQFDGDTMTYEIKFQETSDKARFGMVERATLIRAR